MNKLILTLLLATFVYQVFGQATFQSNVSTTGAWNNSGSWTRISGTDSNGIPDADDDVFILAGDIITVSGTQNVNNLTINSSGVLRFSSNSDELDFADGGDLIVNSGGAIQDIANNTRLRFFGDHNITINGSINIDYYTFDGTSGVVIFDGNGSSTTNRLEINNNYDITFNHTGTYTIVSALNIDYTITLDGTGTLTLNGGSNGTDINLRNTADLSIGCTVNIEDDLATQADNLSLTILNSGYISIGDQFRIGAGAGASGNNLNLMIDNGGELYIESDITGNNETNLSASNSGILSLHGGITGIQNTGDLILTNNATGMLNIGADIDNQTILDFTAVGNTVRYYEAGPQTIENPSSGIYHHLIFPISGTKSLSGVADIQGNLTISGTSIFNLSGNNLSVGGDWINSSTNADPLNQGTATITFNGSSAQNIYNTGNALGTEFYNLTINNSTSGSSDITLNADADVIVTNNLELIDGIVVTSSTNSLTLNSGSSVTLSGSPQDNSFVSGPLTRVVNSNALTNLTFPIGKDGIYRRVDLNIDQSNTNTTSYVAEVFNASGAGLYNKPSGIERISSVRYYNVSQSPATALDGAQLRIYYGVDDEVEDPPTLTVVKQNGVDWQDITGSAAGAPVGSILSGTFTSFSDFALGSTSLLNPLPIELLSFQGKLANGVVNLNWSTASEKNNDYFTVEKTTDFQQFDVVEVIPGSGNSSQKLDYTTEDKNPYPGVSYYRLKQTDFDGTTSYSRIISVENNHYSEPRVVLYPNPANQATCLLTSNFYEDNLQIKIYSNRGQLVKDVSLNKDEAAQFNNEINLNDLSSGLYMVEITSFNQAFFKKLVIK